MDGASGAAFDLEGRTALVTGATNGLGLEIARQLARRGATVLVGGRSAQRIDLAVDRLAADVAPGFAMRLRPALADFASMAEVGDLADRLLAGPPLDLLFLNAGIHDVPHGLTAEGHERTLATNYLGHFLLVHRLVSAGHLAPEARLVVSQSQAVHSNPFAWADVEALVSPRSTRLRRLVWRAIGSPNSKVLLAHMMLELARRVEGGALAGIEIVAGSPGALRTGNVDQPGIAMKLLKLVAPLVLRPAAEGAGLLVWLATAPELAGHTGELYGIGRGRIELSRRARDREAARRSWETTERVLGLSPLAPPWV